MKYLDMFSEVDDFKNPIKLYFWIRNFFTLKKYYQIIYQKQDKIIVPAYKISTIITLIQYYPNRLH